LFNQPHALMFRLSGKHILIPPILILFLVLILGFSGNTYTPDNPPDAKTAWTFKNVSYGPDPMNTLDIALPSGRSAEKTPLVIFIHGGGWFFGDKSFHKKEIELFADSGFACASINYRFMSNSKNIHQKEITGDVLLAIDYICKHAKAWNISADRIGLAGHSAGGHLSMIVGYAQNPEHRIKAVASWSGPSNFLDPKQPNGKGSENVFAAYTGVQLNKVADTVLWKEASPFYVVHSGCIPTLLVQGANDPIVPAVVAEHLKARLDSLGVKNDFLLLKNSGHLYTLPDLQRARAKTCRWFKENL
jgi:acetyl esterase/lipase